MARRAFPFQGVLRPMRTKKRKNRKAENKNEEDKEGRKKRKVLENSSNYQSWTKHQLLSKYQI